jgi:hypothetical protein
VSSRDPYDDEPSYLDLGKWLRIAVTAASALVLLILIFVAATDQDPTLPTVMPGNPTAVPVTLPTSASGASESATATPSATPTLTVTPTIPATLSTLGSASPSVEVSVPEMVRTAACSRLSCSEFYSRTELDSYLLQCPDDYGRFDRDSDGRACWDSDDW